jgi:hypothetical protein
MTSLVSNINLFVVVKWVFRRRLAAQPYTVNKKWCNVGIQCDEVRGIYPCMIVVYDNLGLSSTYITWPQGPSLSALRVMQPQVSHSAKPTHVSAQVKSPSMGEQVYDTPVELLEDMVTPGNLLTSIFVDDSVRSSWWQESINVPVDQQKFKARTTKALLKPYHEDDCISQ